ncbi:hypothetical protein GWL_18830 [Herbaspirillum sp. GW103]|uniref:hypothetical protein n=1 Tax=Herbaspirillum sp. GW103 TaxID=1175306 RepID=UPI00025E357F|nr:hypothetical protein [Herbaspirillum sp. GW103]EIJ47642.1 hypothetical protein GWL_18830 [Herbaspirillum sp. GW103]
MPSHEGESSHAVGHWLDANEVDAIYSKEAVSELVELSNAMAELGLTSYRTIYDKHVTAVRSGASNGLRLDLAK